MGFAKWICLSILAVRSVGVLIDVMFSPKIVLGTGNSVGSGWREVLPAA